MARNLATAGFALTVFDLAPEPLARLAAEGARVAASLREMAGACEIVEVCVRDDAQVEDVLFGGDGLVGAARPDTIVAVHSTIRPRTVVRLAARAAAGRVHVLDVPITGAARGAEARTLCYMAGGDAALIERCRPVFETSGSRIVHTGALGSGMATKLCNNVMMYLGFLAAFEATSLAEGAGVSEDTLKSVTEANGVMTRPMLYYLEFRKRVLADAGDVAMREQVEKLTDLAEKDLAIAVEFARELGVSLPGAAACERLMAAVYGRDGRQKA
jgi:3-hydroxyisobutyrate dehydrogenase-like beta-hydroxyacid dehydrogenase